MSVNATLDIPTMKHSLKALNQWLEGRARGEILTFAVCGILIIGAIDYVTGFELSMSLFYLGPVAAAAWYAGRWGFIAVLSCVAWYLADVAAGSHYSHGAIPIWNALVRLGFFLITGLLLTALRKTFLVQRSLARTDHLTGLYNRHVLLDRLEHDLALAQRSRSALTLAYIDMDDFKVINDTDGHTEGDRALRTIGEVLRSSVREVDTAARLGGDEFALVLPNTDGSEAKHVISHLTGKLHRAFGPDDRRITCSIGVVTFLDSVISPEQAVAAADDLMYRVKREAKGTVLFSVHGQSVQHRAAAGFSPAERRRAGTLS
jgi:diguanylate cyclase (GGDEF)-like protein